MENPFEYPDDRSELFEPENEECTHSEEAHFYHTLADFEELVLRYGTDAVMNRLLEPVFMKLATWFLEDDDEEWMLDV